MRKAIKTREGFLSAMNRNATGFSLTKRRPSTSLGGKRKLALLSIYKNAQYYLCILFNKMQAI
jgi:hypothetical protein